MTSIFYIQQITQKFLDVFTSSFKCVEEDTASQKRPAAQHPAPNTPDAFNLRMAGAGRKQTTVAPSP